MQTADSSSSFGSQLIEDSTSLLSAGFSTDRICGESSSCTVYRMRINGQQVAVKRLHRNLITDPTYVAAYRKEYLIGSRLKHDALPTYRGMLSDLDDVYIVMDYIDGIALADFTATEEGKLFFRDPSNFRRFLTQLLDAITYMHRSGVIHCDLKPSNIMLRHSDRAVMILDLDKSYCDTLDLTHGGTKGISEVIDGGKKPTIRKDIAAMGNIIDFIARTVPGAPLRKIQRFRKQCADMNTSEEKLLRALQPAGSWVRWAGIGAAVLLTASISASSLLYTKTSETTLNQPSVTKDTVVLIKSERGDISEENVHNAVAQDKPESKTESKSEPGEITAADFDNRMQDFIKEAEKSLVILRTKKLTDEEFQNMTSRVPELYTTSYNEMLNDYKKKYSDKSDMDIYMAITKASESSKAFKLLNTYILEVRDSLNSRLGKL